jgi:hypothetical protein
MLEGINVVAAMTPPRYRPRTPRDEALLLGRTCYDHLAGRLGVSIADALVANAQITLGDDAGEVTPAGAAFLRDLGIDLGAAERRSQRIFCRPCIDWTERRPHLDRPSHSRRRLASRRSHRDRGPRGTDQPRRDRAPPESRRRPG